MQNIDPSAPRTREQLAKELKEMNEAISAAYAARTSADNALAQLEKADNWATWDVWGGKGLLTHMMKYNKIDQAQEEMELLNANLRELQRQLADVAIYDPVCGPSIDGTTQVVDYLFDNIFTDLRVRDEIRASEDQMLSLLARLDALINRLQGSRREIERRLAEMG